MPSLARTILFALHAASFLALTGLAPGTTTALASPLPETSPAHVGSSLSSLLAPRVVGKHIDAELAVRAYAASPAVASPSTQPAAHQSEVEKKFRAYANVAQQHANAMQRLAAKAKSSHQTRDNVEFQQACVENVKDFQVNYQDFHAYIISLGDKGLGCLDKSVPLEESLKDIVNAHKQLLAASVDLISGIPVLGPMLQPTLYAIKCLVIELLDLTEDVVDCTINLIVNLLVALGLRGVLEALCAIPLLCLL